MKACVSSLCAFHLIAVVFCEITFDCETLQGLCPGQEYQMSCSVHTEYVYQKVTISDGNCVKKAIELDFTLDDISNPFESTQDKKCGEFNATSTIQNEWKRIELSFTATESINRSTAICFGQSSKGQTINRSCIITLEDDPEPPSSLSISTSLPVTVSWSRPKNAKDLLLDYIVVIISSLGRNETLKLNDTSLLLDEKDAINDNITYRVCVSTQNCVGESAPGCMERTIYTNATRNTSVSPIVNTLPVLYLNARVLHDKVVLLWSTSSQRLLSNFCYDIERNHHIQYSCVSLNSLTSQTEKEFDVTESISPITSIYRVRINSNGALGEWAHPICITARPQFSHDVSIADQKTNPGSIAAINLAFKLKKMVFDISNCTISNVPANRTDYLVKQKLEYTLNVTLSHEREQQLKLRLETDLLTNITLEPFTVNLTSEDDQVYNKAPSTKPNYLFISFFLFLALYCFIRN